MAQSEAELILRTLDGFLTGPARIRLLGGRPLSWDTGCLVPPRTRTFSRTMVSCGP